ncbi:MopE-related protein [Thermodesulfobacteriota bacterium]
MKNKVLTTLIFVFLLSPCVLFSDTFVLVDCTCDSEYHIGERVFTLVDNPQGAAGILAGHVGTVICGSTTWPGYILISWDAWDQGHEGEGHCTCPAGSAPENTGWWVLCEEIDHLYSDVTCVCGGYYTIGNRVTLQVDNPDGNPTLLAGHEGTIVCGSTLLNRILVSWDGWQDGHNGNEFCECPAGDLPDSSGWWVDCEMILLSPCTEKFNYDLGCNSYWIIDTFGGRNDLDNYSCVGFTESGPEIGGRLILAEEKHLVVDLYNLTADLDLFLLDEGGLGEACSDQCIDYSSTVGDEQIDTVVGPGTYYIIIDGYAGAEGTSDMHIYCCVDGDADGYDDVACGGGDCDDADATVYPGAEEICDLKDNDCNGIIDDNPTDADGDGYPVCQDCDDLNPNVNPGAPEIPDNGIDDNCNGQVDEGCFIGMVI